jgi:uncharacterized membrane protein
MITMYSLFKFLHIVGAIGWIGGLITFSLLSISAARENDPSVLATMTRLMRLNGMLVIGPAAGLTLIAGMVMIAVSSMGVPFWVIWGFAAISVSIALGATLIRRANDKARAVVTTTEPGDPRLRAAQRWLATLNLINVLVLLSAVWAMVVKPNL